MEIGRVGVVRKEGTLVDRRVVMFHVKPQCSAQISRAAGEPGRVGLETAALGGEVGSAEDLASAEETAVAGALGSADNVPGTVDAVGNIDVHVPARTKHCSVAPGGAAEGVGGGVLGAEVGLDFGEADSDACVAEHPAEELWGDDVSGLSKINAHSAPDSSPR